MVDVDSRRKDFESFGKSQQSWGFSHCCAFVCNEQVRRSNLSRRNLHLEEVRNFGSISNRMQSIFCKIWALTEFWGFSTPFGDFSWNGRYVLAPWEWLLLTEEDFQGYWEPQQHSWGIRLLGICAQRTNWSPIVPSPKSGSLVTITINPSS